MVQVVRTAWSANRHWVAAGFLASTSLFLLLMFANWSNEHRGIEAQKAAGLSSSAWYPPLLAQQKTMLSSLRLKEHAQPDTDKAYGKLGAVPGGIDGISADARPGSPVDNIDQQVIRSSTLEIMVTDPLRAAEQLRNLAAQFSGFVVSSTVNGSDQRARSAQVIMRIPAERLDEARAQVRTTIAKSVEQDTIEVRDVTREYVDQQAKLRSKCLG